MFNKKAFTLTELLVALGIVGVIAVLAIPSLVNNINNRVQVTQLKNTITLIQQLAQNQLVQYKTQDLRDTDFASSTALFTYGNFEIAKTCTTPAKDCWKTSPSLDDSEKITYRKISDKSELTMGWTRYNSIVLKNGVILAYTTMNQDYGDDKLIGRFCVDTNGNDNPNMLGRDYFCFYVTKTARIVATTDDSTTQEENIEICTEATSDEDSIIDSPPHYCTKSIIESNWKMNY